MAVIYATLRDIIDTSQVFTHLFTFAEWMTKGKTLTLALDTLSCWALVGSGQWASKVLKACACVSICYIVKESRSTRSILTSEILSCLIKSVNRLTISWKIRWCFQLRRTKKLYTCILIPSAYSLSTSEGCFWT